MCSHEIDRSNNSETNDLTCCLICSKGWDRMGPPQKDKWEKAHPDKKPI